MDDLDRENSKDRNKSTLDVSTFMDKRRSNLYGNGGAPVQKSRLNP